MLSEKPWKPVDFAVIMAVLGSILLAGAFSGMVGSRESEAAEPRNPTVNFIISFLLYGAILILVHIMVRRRGASWRTAFGLASPRRGSALFMAVGVTLMILPIAWGLGIISAVLMEKIHMTPVLQQSIQTLQNSPSVESRVYLAILAVIVAPITEEVMFRGILYPYIRHLGYRRIAMLGTAIVFGAIHFNMMHFVPLTFLGVVLAWLYETTDNLLAPIIAHGVFNLTNFLQTVIETSNWTMISILCFAVGGIVTGIMVLFRQPNVGQNDPIVSGPNDERI